MSEPSPPQTAGQKVPDRTTLLLATVFAAFVAGVALLLFVLPAEHGIDPTGFGRITGIGDLHDGSAELDLGGQAGAIHHAEDAPPRNDTITITLAAGDEAEYKFHLDEGQGLVYAWNATGTVAFDFHGEPDEPSRPGEFASYSAGQGSEASGGFQAPFTGRHGWYFRNDGDQSVSVTLQVWGHYTVIGFV